MDEQGTAWIEPGGLLEYDYRATTSPPAVTTGSLRVVQWNVERNYEAEGIIDSLKALNPDVCVLQEVDVGCRRSGGRNHMQELCEALQMKGVFVCEFWELDSPLRKERDAGGGIHGNAILTKHDLTTRVLDHEFHAYDWDHDGEALQEPRKGRRYTLVGTVQQGTLPPVLFYNVHLEVFTGIIGRVNAFSEILDDARHSRIVHQAIVGDLNTMAHSIARVSPKYARDRYRFLSLGWTEADVWDRVVLGWHDDQGSVNLDLLTMRGCAWWWRPVCWGLRALLAVAPHWGHAAATFFSGFSTKVAARARNPGFYDPWPPRHVTLHNPSYLGLFCAKLDWTLVRHLHVDARQAGNTDYRHSDHQWLLIDVTRDDVASSIPADTWQQWRAMRDYWHTQPLVIQDGKM
ncbi:Endonuclease/exonuclease/phosphatase [Gongronella butleri]|nr:Endonuclease/exonuclease/phosphatase [Gongronella butleri]